MTVYKSLHGLAPEYVATDGQLTSSVRQREARSSDIQTLIVPQPRSKFRDRAFAAATAKKWDSLPVDLRDQSITIPSFATL